MSSIVSSVNRELTDYNDVCEYLESNYPELNALGFYSEIFPVSALECKGDTHTSAPNPLMSYKDTTTVPGKVLFRTEILFRDTFVEGLSKAFRNPMALCAPLLYCGRRRTADNAFLCCGICIDLDDVGLEQLENFWGLVEHTEDIPRPSYLSASGHGLHVYYIFENPVPLYRDVSLQLQLLKRGLTMKVWCRETSRLGPAKRQFQGIYQAYRMTGSQTKIGPSATSRFLVRTFRTGPLVTLDYLLRYVDDEYKSTFKVDYASWCYSDKEHKSLRECQEAYPEWYKRRIIEKRDPNQWRCNRGLYDWWKDKITREAREGARFYCIQCLFIYAKKCCIPKKEVMADAMALLPLMQSRGGTKPKNDFTKRDIRDASKFYDAKYTRWTAKEMIRRSNLTAVPKTRRNGRTREDHLRRAGFVRDGLYPNGSWRPGSKKDQVIAWREAHPNGKKIDCERDLKISRHTVLKWWDSAGNVGSSGV